jgi:phenylacetic acid degradation operon negative regulatory protein
MTGRDLAEAADDAPSEDDALSGPDALTPGSARSLLLTVLGEFVWPTGAPAWTSTLLYVLSGMGIEVQTARQAIARAAAAGWIEPERRGRAVMWSLTPAGRRIFEEGSARVHSMSNPYSSWDGSWLILLVTIPHSHRTARKKLYAGLNWAGFGNPTPGVWLSPHLERKAEVATLIEQLGLGEHTISFTGKTSDVGIGVGEIVAQGWDLAALEDHYQAVLKMLADPAAGSLFAYVRMVSEWQRFPFSDPQLPEALLPDWIGRRAARRIEALRAQWTGQVHARWAEINSSPDQLQSSPGD